MRQMTKHFAGLRKAAWLALAVWLRVAPGHAAEALIWRTDRDQVDAEIESWPLPKVLEAISSATHHIREGKSLTTALEATAMVDNLALEMVKVGEQTGALGDMLTAVADFYDEELENRMAKAIAMVEPIMLVLMAIIVAGMLLAFYLPLFEAISAVERQV